MTTAGMFSRERIETTCVVEIEQTPASLHAHAIPDGVTIRPGDTVLVHDAPAGVAFGDRLTRPCRVTIIRAGWLARVWTEWFGFLEFAELYDVGFEPKHLEPGSHIPRSA